MFADSLLETSWAYRSRRSWTTVTSFGLQAFLIGLLLVIPLLTTVGLPTARTTVSTPVSLGRPNQARPPQTQGARNAMMQIIPYTGPFMAPGHIPSHILRGDDSTPVGPSIGDAISGTDGAPFNPLVGIPVSVGMHPVVPVPAAPAIRQFRTSSMLQGSLIRRVDPLYPPLARSARVQGSVILAAVIAKDGSIENLKLISGHPMLVEAAIEAVRQWRYRPYVLNGEAIEVETRITVNFVLAGN